MIRGNGEPFLGRKTAVKLGVLKIDKNVAVITDLKHTLIEQYPKVFQGVGKLNTKLTQTSNQKHIHCGAYPTI